MTLPFRSGLHHVTLLTGGVQANVDFYAGVLGLRLVKRTGGFEDALQLHLFYGDALGTPGSLVSFLVWEDGGRGRVGLRQVAEIAFAVPPGSIGGWLSRALAAGVPVEGPRREFGEPVLRLRDPDGFIVKLAGADLPAAAPWAGAEGGPAAVSGMAPGGAGGGAGAAAGSGAGALTGIRAGTAAADGAGRVIGGPSGAGARVPPLRLDPSMAVRRLRAVTLLTDTPELTAAYLAKFGYRPGPAEGNSQRMLSATDAVDVRDASGYVPGVPGPGTADHVAFRAPDVGTVLAAREGLGHVNSTPTSFHDRRYFSSLYVREPGGTLFELATDGPGFTVDEAPEHLGETLFVPPQDRARAAELRVRLPQFALPGAPRLPKRDLPFVHRFFTPPDPDGSTLVLLHGSGGSESDLMPPAHRAAPRATLLGVRGRAAEEGAPRWFRRLSETEFDQDDLRAEAAAFAAFLDGAVAGYGLDPARMTVLGHSNGANFAAAVLALHPQAIRRAALLRPLPVLETPPRPDLSAVRVLSVTGRLDPLAPRAEALEGWLRRRGAEVEALEITAGHALDAQDEAVLADWLARG